MKSAPQCSKAVRDILLAIARNGKGFCHHIGTMIANRTRQQLNPIAHNIILPRLMSASTSVCVYNETMFGLFLCIPVGVMSHW